MKFWMKKILVALIAVATLGMYTPTALPDIEAEESKNDLASKADVNHDEDPHTDQALEVFDDNLYKETDLTAIQEQARVQSLEKFGPRIVQQVEDEFNDVILPEMESVLEELYSQSGEGDKPYLGITEKPAQGYGERIFNVTDLHTGKDLAKFHVRRDNRPLEGYYFNFHYHLAEDNFKKHHELGEIYWDKNTPPKWMA